MWKELLIHSPCSHEYSNYSSSKTRSKFDDIQYGSAGKSGASGAFRSSPAERSLRSSGCLQTLITSANGGPFLNRDDANIYIYIDACRHLIPGRRRRRVVQPQPLPSLAPSSSFLLDFLPTETVPADLPATGVPPGGNPMETYLSGCPDDAKSNFVSQEGHVSRLSKVRLVNDENVPPGHDWISGGCHCTRRIESTTQVKVQWPTESRPITDPSLR